MGRGGGRCGYTGPRVCFGQQVLARELGGRVERMDDYEIGYHEVRHSGDSRLFASVEEPFTVFTAHEDVVTELPPDARPIAENEDGIQGFESGNAYAMQFHPEFNLATAREDTRNNRAIDPERRERILSELTEENEAAAREVTAVFDNFVDHDEEAQADRGSIE